MLATLIVCYLRPQDLNKMLAQHQFSDRRIYIFVDKADKENIEINEEVIKLANLQRLKSNVSIKVADKNLGAGKSVPTAIAWISKYEIFRKRIR